MPRWKLDLHTFKSVVLWSATSSVVATLLALVLIVKPMHDKRLLQEKVQVTCQQFRETIRIMGTDEIEAAVTKLVTTYMDNLC